MSEPLTPLAETLARLDELGVALDPEDLTRKTEIPVPQIRTLLDGGELEDGDVEARIRERLQMLCRRRLAESGKTYEDRDAVAALAKEIATAADITPTWARQLVNAEKTPSMKHGHQLTRFFGVPDGYLTETPAAVLNRALQSYLQSEQRAESDLDDPLADLKERFGLQGVARRGEPLSRDEAKRFAGLIADVLQQNMEDQS